MEKTRRIQLTALIGKTASGSKSDYFGVNGYSLQSVQIKGAANFTSGQLELKHNLDVVLDGSNRPTGGQTVATIDTTSGVPVVTGSLDGFGNGTVAYVEITTNLNTAITDAWAILSRT